MKTITLIFNYAMTIASIFATPNISYLMNHQPNITLENISTTRKKLFDLSVGITSKCSSHLTEEFRPEVVEAFENARTLAYQASFFISDHMFEKMLWRWRLSQSIIDEALKKVVASQNALKLAMEIHHAGTWKRLSERLIGTQRIIETERIERLMRESLEQQRRMSEYCEIEPSETGSYQIIRNFKNKRLDQVVVAKLFIGECAKLGIFPDQIKLTLNKEMSALAIVMLLFRSNPFCSELISSPNFETAILGRTDLAGNESIFGETKISHPNGREIVWHNMRDVMSIFLEADGLAMPKVYSAPVVSINPDNLSNSSIDFIQVIITESSETYSSPRIEFLQPTDPKDEVSFQAAFNEAIKLCPDYDFKGKIFQVGKSMSKGPSASGALLCALIAAVRDTAPVRGKIVSCAFCEDGNVSGVGLTSDKAKACAQYGYELLTVPNYLPEEYQITDFLEYAKEDFGINLPQFALNDIGSVKATLEKESRFAELVRALDQLKFDLEGKHHPIRIPWDILKHFFPQGEHNKLDNAEILRIYKMNSELGKQ